MTYAASGTEPSAAAAHTTAAPPGRRWRLGTRQRSAATLTPSSASAAGEPPVITVLSNRADLISGGDALVDVALPDGSSADDMRVELDGRDITHPAAFTTLDRWLAAIEFDTSDDPLETKVRRNKPTEATDTCGVAGQLGACGDGGRAAGQQCAQVPAQADRLGGLRLCDVHRDPEAATPGRIPRRGLRLDQAGRRPSAGQRSVADVHGYRGRSATRPRADFRADLTTDGVRGSGDTSRHFLGRGLSVALSDPGHRLRGDLVTDAHPAALAIEHG